MTKQEKLKVYNDCRKEIESLNETEGVDFCHYNDPFSVGFYVERLEDDDLGKLFDVNGYLMRHKFEMIAQVYRFTMSNQNQV